MDGAPTAGDELSDAFSASLLDPLVTLSPASARFFDGSLGGADWGDAGALESPAAPPLTSAATTPPTPAATTENASRPAAATARPDGKPGPGRRRKPASNLKANLRRSKHRDSEKRETMFLRAYSQALEQELGQLQQRKEARLQAEKTRPRSEKPTAKLVARNQLWRSLALLRRKERKLSEEESARLRALWKAQLHFAAQMQRIMSVPRTVGPAGGERARVTFSEVDVEVFDTLLSDLDTLYKQTGRVLAESGLACLPEARYHSIQRRDAIGTGNMDLLDVTVLRSSYSSLKDGMWDSILAKFFARGGARFHVSSDQGGHTVTMKMRYQAAPEQRRRGGEDGDEEDELFFEVVLAIRKYVVAPDRELVVWKSLNFGDGGLSGLVANETGHSVMHRSLLKPEFTTMKRIRRLESMGTTDAPLVPAATSTAKAGGKSDVRDDEDVPVEEVFSSLSLSAMEDDIDGALRNVGYD